LQKLSKYDLSVRKWQLTLRKHSKLRQKSREGTPEEETPKATSENRPIEGADVTCDSSSADVPKSECYLRIGLMDFKDP